MVVSKKYTDMAPAPILRLHRHGDGYIAFARERDGDDFRPLVSIRASELETWFPAFREDLERDGFVGINADWRLRSVGEHGESYGYPLHSSDRLRYINACYVDIDFYKLNLDLGTVIGRVINLQESGQLPYASMLVRSGQGLWLLWFVHDVESPDLSQRAFPDKLELYSHIQAAIIERLLPLGADMAARDAARYLRIPGSWNTSAEGSVEWWVQGKGDAGYVYTLRDLALRLRAFPVHRHGREIIAHNPAKRRGWVALNARRLRDFNTLRALRGGFSQGCRNNAAKLYAWLLRCNATCNSDVIGLTTNLGRECHPFLSKSEVKDAVQYSKKMQTRRMFDQTISDWLRITATESEILERLPPAGRPRVVPVHAPIASIRQAMDARRAAIQAILAEVGYVPTVRAMAAIIHANHQTVLNDYNSLGIKWGRTTEAQKEKQGKQGSLY